MRVPSILTADEALARNMLNVRINIDDAWVPCRPEPFWALPERWRAAWLVLTGRADALKWIKQ